MKNTLLTQNARMGLDGKVHWRNLLQIVIGDSGAGNRCASGELTWRLSKIVMALVHTETFLTLNVTSTPY